MFVCFALYLHLIVSIISPDFMIKHINLETLYTNFMNCHTGTLS